MLPQVARVAVIVKARTNLMHMRVLGARSRAKRSGLIGRRW